MAALIAQNADGDIVDGEPFAKPKSGYSDEFARPMVNIPKTLRSFRFAGQGVIALFRYENNARFHAAAALTIVATGLWLGLTTTEWAIILTQIGLVFMAEAVNTALEKLCDVVSPAQHPTIKAVKDMAAGGVLILAITSVLVGLLILGPKLLLLFTTARAVPFLNYSSTH